MTRGRWLVVVVTTGVGVWLWNRAKEAGRVEIGDRGVVIFDNTPLAGAADDPRRRVG
jgi:hypothetical protein